MVGARPNRAGCGNLSGEGGAKSPSYGHKDRCHKVDETGVQPRFRRAGHPFGAA